MRIALPALILALFTAGCGAPEPRGGARNDVDATPPPEVFGSTEPPTAGSSAEGLTWSLRGEQDHKSLVYEMADTGEVQLALSCTNGARRVHLWREIGPDEAAEFHIASGQASAVYPARVHPSEVSAGLLDAVAPVDAPVFRVFVRTGALTQRINGEHQLMIADAGSRARISRFFAFCGATA